MFDLGILNKSILKIGVLTCLLIVISSCRKEIVHEPMVSIAEETWVAKDYGILSKIYCTEIFNGELYFGGIYYDDAKVAKYTGNQIVEILPGPLDYLSGGGTYDDPVVNDLTVINGKLHIGGNFKYNEGAGAKSFMTYDANGVTEEIPLLSYNQTYITDVVEFNGDLIVCGNFGPFEPLVTTGNVERIQNGTAVGFASLQGPVRQLKVHNNELYAVGDNVRLQKWDGSAWVAEPYIGETSSDEIYSIESFNSELYIFGSFDNYEIVKKRDANGIWSDFPALTGSDTYNSNGGIKALDGEIFAFGHGFKINGVYNSNVIKLEGNTWKNIGNLKSVISQDLIKYDGKLILVYGASTFFEYPYP